MYDIYKELRDQRGLSDYAFAKKSGVPRSVLSDWKNAKHTPSLDNLKKIANCLNVSVSYLMGEESKSVIDRVTDWHKAMATGDPDLYLFEKYKSDPIFWENIGLLFYLPPNRKQFVYDTIRSQNNYSEEDKEKEGINSYLSEVI
jgi:transcriptional regulator with XRE-family HTH domain